MAVDYTKDEPIKEVLIAAAAGAVLMGLIALMMRSKTRRLHEQQVGIEPGAPGHP